MPFLLKSLEKLLDMYMRTHLNEKNLLDPAQHAYSKGKGTESALHEIIYNIENNKFSGNKPLVSLAAFMDIQGAFDKTNSRVVETALREHRFDAWITNWIIDFLNNRKLRPTENKQSCYIKPNQGIPQGSCLSPLIWTLVVNLLVRKIKGKGRTIVIYADDVCILLKADKKNTKELIGNMNEALEETVEWCQENGLDINPEKTEIISFGTKDRLEVKIKGKIVKEKGEVKYLGVYLDKKLNFNAHFDYIIGKANKALWACKSLGGKHWGLDTSKMIWIYNAMVIPVITYASIIFWHRAQKSAKYKLSKFQRNALQIITGAMHSTPTLAPQRITGICDLDLKIQATAYNTYMRLASNGTWKAQSAQKWTC